MHAKLEAIAERFRALTADLTSPGLMSDRERYLSLHKEYKLLLPIAEKYAEYKAAVRAMKEAEEMLSDRELAEMAAEEYRLSRAHADTAYGELRLLLLPRDPNDDKNLVMEIRACAGGEEAALFAADLYRMYSMYAQAHGFRIEILSENETDLGGMREISFLLSGDGAYSAFKFESGVHRVQRIPVTDSQGKIQTSTVSVAVLPEAEEVDVEILESDLEITTCKSSGAGGQHINKTESAIRILHRPSGIVVECQEERSQFKNRDKAMRLLRTRLYDIQASEQSEKIAATRKSQVGSGDRSEKIRTYNYPQSRITDHRIGMTVHNLQAFLNGDIGEMLRSLKEAETAEKLKGE